MIRNCKNCLKDYVIYRESKFCSQSCKKEYTVKKNAKKCLGCNNFFSPDYSRRKYCSQPCFNSFIQTNKHKLICFGCGKEKFSYNKKYCSNLCKENRTIKKICKICKSEFTTFKSEGSDCCNPKCGYSYRSSLLFIRLEVELPDFETLYNLYINQDLSYQEISLLYNIKYCTLIDLAKRLGIKSKEPRFGKKITTSDGHIVASRYERQIDDWLVDNNIQHQYEPKISCNRRYKADFLANGFYIEFWGLTTPKYLSNKMMKLKIYKDNNLPLIELSREDFRSNLWKKKLSRILLS